LVPLAVVARTRTVFVPAGVVAVHCVVDEQFTFVAGELPNRNVVPPTTKFEPLIVTVVPPVGGPLAGCSLAIVGTGETSSSVIFTVAVAGESRSAPTGLLSVTVRVSLYSSIASLVIATSNVAESWSDA